MFADGRQNEKEGESRQSVKVLFIGWRWGVGRGGLYEELVK